MKTILYNSKMSQPLILKTSLGFSLIEVLMAMMLIAVAGSIFITTSHNSLIGNHRSKVYGDVAMATEEALESLVLLPLDSIKSLNSTPMKHSQGTSVTVQATSRRIQSTDVDHITSQDTSTLRYVTLASSFKNQAGAWITKTYSLVVYRPQ
jgi:prepilin-type N-terminal cleavage/methylation domain-containing protein